MSFIVIIALSLCLYSSAIESTGRSFFSTDEQRSLDFSFFLCQEIIRVQRRVPSFLPMDCFIDCSSSFDDLRCFELGSFFSSNGFVFRRIALYSSHTDRRNRWDLKISRSTLSDVSIRGSVTLSKVVWKTYGLLLGLFAFSRPTVLRSWCAWVPSFLFGLFAFSIYLTALLLSTHFVELSISAKPILELLFLRSLWATLLIGARALTSASLFLVVLFRVVLRFFGLRGFLLYFSNDALFCALLEY